MGLVVGALILALYVQSNAALYGFDVVSEGLSRGILMALGMLAVNSALGFYERSRNKSTGQMRARAVLSFVLSGAIAAGVLWLTFNYGSFPWIALSLAASFGFYGFIRKLAVVDSVPGLAIGTFAKVVELGSFARAAERIGLSTSAVSRQVSELESHLNVRLLNRTTRRLSLTEAGQSFYEHSVQLLSDLADAEASVRIAAAALGWSALVLDGAFGGIVKL